MIPILFTVLVGGLALHYFATREQLAKEAAARSEAQRLAVESQLRLLRAQLEPHMLFNTLANVRSLVREDVAGAESMIDQLIVYLRSALAASQTESVALSREFAQLRAYLDIMALRMGPRLAYRLELPAALERTEIPPMLLQPLVENAIKHGLDLRRVSVGFALHRAWRSELLLIRWPHHPPSTLLLQGDAGTVGYRFRLFGHHGCKLCRHRASRWRDSPCEPNDAALV